MMGGERKSSGNVFREVSAQLVEALERIRDPEYFQPGGLSEEEKSDAVEVLYLVLEFAQDNGIIDSYDDAKMRSVCGEGI
jgi:hypothetical protein